MNARTLAATLLGVLGAAHAEAAPCDGRAHADPGAPARIGPGPAGFGSLAEACPGSDVALQADTALLVATDDFYGSVGAGASVRLRYAPTERLWLSLWAPGLDFRYVANATVTASSTDLGASALGLHLSLPAGSRTRFSPYARVLVPTESVFVNATRWGFEHGFALAYSAHERLELVGGATFPALFTETAARVHASYQPGLGAEALYAPWRWLTLLGGATARFRFGDDAAFESLDPTVGLRFFLWRNLRAELSTRLPLFGADRTDIAIGLNVGWMFGR